MNHILSIYQRQAIDSIVKAFNEKKGFVCIATPIGSGIGHITTSVISELLSKNTKVDILCLFDRKTLAEQLESNLDLLQKSLKAKNQVTVSTYSSFKESYDKNKHYDFVYCDHAENLTKSNASWLLTLNSDLVLGRFSYKNNDIENVFFGAPYIYENVGVIYREYNLIKNIMVPLFEKLGYEKIELEKRISINNKTICPDIIAQKEDITYSIELKSYRGINIDKAIIKNAISQTSSYSDVLNKYYKKHRAVLVLMCIVDDQTKQDILDEKGIMVYDIKNIMYLCQKHEELYSNLEQIIPYPLTTIEGCKPLSFKELNHSTNSKTNLSAEEYANDLIDRLKNCKPGNDNNAYLEHEKICEEIISYLFKSEFSHFKTQHTTSDNVFRMDMLCGIKGSAEFWKTLMQFYNTRFVVFECKNYVDTIDQNLIFITNKYLFPSALRNVAFIISRKGFSQNAELASLGILKEQGKLIIDLKDDDLKIMIKNKVDGNEPSDYLLDKLDKILMSISF